MKTMILAAGRGERMRPLTDHTPKPLLPLGGKPLIVWQIERLARAGFMDLVINHAWLGEQIETALGDGSQWGVRIAYSREGEPLETAGGIAQALPLLDDPESHVFLCVSADIFCEYDYRLLRARARELDAMAEPGLHLVMTPNPPFNPDGDFALDANGRLSLHGTPRVTFANIGLYDRRMFTHIAPGTFVRMRPYYEAAIAAGRAGGELFTGRWENIGTPEQLHSIVT